MESLAVPEEIDALVTTTLEVLLAYDPDDAEGVARANKFASTEAARIQASLVQVAPLFFFFFFFFFFVWGKVRRGHQGKKTMFDIIAFFFSILFLLSLPHIVSLLHTLVMSHAQGA